MRFDATFFAAATPDGQAVSLDAGESSAHAWIGPAAALREVESGTMHMAPPTSACLMELEASVRHHGVVAAVLRAEGTRVVVPVLPKMIRGASHDVAVLPWDPEYDALPGEGIPGVDATAMSARLPSRIEFRRGPSAR